ncbi:MAG: hypothetical protein DI538_16145 [Azospira oryzae]|jgi:hypothetical protein|nr:MAG: hypothetical protein DI538_16145 [Azospira oryzae]
MKSAIAVVIGLIQLTAVFAQSQSVTSNTFADAAFAIGNHEGSLSLLFIHNWRLGANKKLGVGLGGRITSYLGANQYYITAPASLTSESTSPLIFFKENVTANIDSLLVKSPQITSVNASINIDYRVSAKVIVGFNIDAIGFSFGSKQKGNYINGYQGKNTEGNPTSFNVLLISDNDRGSLNSELYGKYLINDTWALKAGAQFLFTEYTTVTEVQQFPSANDRFRNKSLLFALGVSYQLKNR